MPLPSPSGCRGARHSMVLLRARNYVRPLQPPTVMTARTSSAAVEAAVARLCLSGRGRTVQGCSATAMSRRR
jgi:hypothetical protein